MKQQSSSSSHDKITFFQYLFLQTQNKQTNKQKILQWENIVSVQFTEFTLDMALGEPGQRSSSYLEPLFVKWKVEEGIETTLQCAGRGRRKMFSSRYLTRLSKIQTHSFRWYDFYNSKMDVVDQLDQKKCL